MKQLFRWAGSKKQQIKHLAPYFSEYTFSRYLECFAGSACLYFHLEPGQAILNDTNKELIDTYRAIKTNPKAVYKNLISFPVSKEFYYELRDKKIIGDMFYQAARFTYLNRFCFNGLYRTNLQGAFNVPCGSIIRNGSLPSLEHLVQASTMLRNTALYNDNFEKFIQINIQENDFIYLDPPYFKKGKNGFIEYGPNLFTQEKLIEVISLLDFIDSKKAYFVLSYLVCPEINAILAKWNYEYIDVNRIIAGNIDKRNKSREILITNIPREKVW
ncbi:MAG: DNA adenine methylase [Eubacteriales bacterium]